MEIKKNNHINGGDYIATISKSSARIFQFVVYGSMAYKFDREKTELWV